MQLSRLLILASASPRRAELLQQVGLTFHTRPTHTDEPAPMPGEDLLAWAREAALAKARATARVLPTDTPSALILGADTVVVLPVDAAEDAPRLHGQSVRVLGKPQDAEDARRMLHTLSGRCHSVLSAFALLTYPEGEAITDVVETQVYFRELAPDEIAEYVASGEPLDKAGAYGIQGCGAILVERIAGDYYTVVGLPLARLWQELHRWKVDS